MEQELLHRIRTNDPTLTKLHLVLEPTAYFHADEHDLGAFLQLLRHNTSITYVLLERRLARGLSQAEYLQLLRAIFEIPHLHEVEIWSQRLSWPALWSALAPAKELRKLGLGMVTLTDLVPVAGQETVLDPANVSPHSSLETFYLSDFRLLPTAEIEKVDDNNETLTLPNLDPVLQILGRCPRLTRVEIFSFPEERACVTSVWPLFAATPQLTHVTLRRLHLPASAVRVVSDNDSIVMNSPLRVLDLGENPLGDAGCTSLFQQLGRAPWRSCLRELNLKKTQCTTAVAPILWETLSTTETVALEKLNLASNKLRDDGARVMARLLELPTLPLQNLELAGCHITNTGAAAIARSLTRNTQLRFLGLAFNQIDNDAYVAFGQALARDNQTLQSINLQVDRKLIYQTGCMALQEMCRKNTTLRDVSTLLNTVVANAQGNYGRRILMYLRLNQAGRAAVANNKATLEEWIQLLATVNDDLFAVHYILRTHPNYAALVAQRLRAIIPNRNGGNACVEPLLKT